MRKILLLLLLIFLFGYSTAALSDTCPEGTTPVYSCPDEFTLNQSSNVCEANPTCAMGSYSSSLHECVEQPTILENGEKTCPQGASYDKVNDVCFIPAVCPTGGTLNTTSNKCEVESTLTCQEALAPPLSGYYCFDDLNGNGAIDEDEYQQCLDLGDNNYFCPIGSMECVPPQAPPPSPDGLVGSWHMDTGSGTTIYDSSGHGNNGTIHGAAWVDGVSGKALSFDGQDGSYVDCGNSPSVNITNAITIIYSYKRFGGNSRSYTEDKISKREAYNVSGCGSSHLVAKIGGHTDTSLGAAGMPSDNVWYRLAHTYDSSTRTGKAYRDGVLQQTVVLSGLPYYTTDSTSTPLTISYPIGYTVNGIIDEVRIYNRALSPQEIEDEHENSSHIYTCPLGPDYSCVNVNGVMKCSKNNCVNIGTGNNTEEISADNSSYQDDGGHDADGVCLGQIYIFNGKGYQCRTAGVDTIFKNCCGSDVAIKNQGSILLIIPQCNMKDAETDIRTDAGVCHYVGKFCSKKLNLPCGSICLQHKKTYCCFHSKLGRIIQEQGRPQLKSFNYSGDWGDPESPNCRGLTPEEFQMIDFDKVDLSEYFGEVAEQIQGKAAQIQQTEQNKISNFYQQTTGGN